MSLHIKVYLPSVIEFAFDREPLLSLRALEVVNKGKEPQENLVLELVLDAPFCEKQTWPVQSLEAGSTLPLAETAVKLERGFFVKLPEQLTAEVRLRLLKGDEVLASHSQSITLIPPQPKLSLIYDHSINYAFQQNSIPVVKELRLQNNGTARRDLMLRLTTEPAFAPAVEIRLQAIEPGGEFRMSPPELKLKLSHDFLADLNEKVAGWLKVELIEGGTVIQSITEPISLLARNEWCGLVALPEILAAFVLPNDPVVMTILGRASEILKEATNRSSFNAYQDKSRKRAWEQVAAIYKAIGELGIRYIVAPASFETTGQKVRFPSEILSQRFGNCLDLTLLFAACCEQAGLRPFVFIHEGHAYAGCWLEERSLPEPAGDDLQQVRKLATDELIIVFEATTVAADHPGTLNDGELLAKPHLQKEAIFRLALDIHAARSARIHPLPVPGQAIAQHGPAGRVGPNSAAVGLGNRDFADEITITEAVPAKPSNRIDLWKSRLLDLSLRNRLLNFRETKSTIRILAEPEHVEDELATERELSLRCKPKMMSEDDPRHAATYTREQRADALKDHLKEELQSGRLHTHLEDNEHARRLTELFRSARNALEENGTNTLFAAVGILEWRETEHSDRVHRAPLLLVPVELKRKSVLEGFSLRRIDEETRLNVTLMEMLKQHFRKDIAGLDPLPEDENGVDVPRVLRIFRDAVRELSGWEVKSEVWLGQFSFTKFLLWKDLADRLEDLTKNRVVRHLIHEAGTPMENPSEDIRAHDLDDRFHPREVLCPRSADSSQLAAVMAAADGHDFVLEGPPGTGKSQTITNIIAHCLAVGKRVLFVAEKRAALDVVHRRLREDGLEPFCLELHSNKTGKKEVLEQFDSALKLTEEMQATDWEHRAAELEHLRTSLNAYSRALHKRLHCGLSAHHCLDYLLPRKDEPVVRLDAWPSVLETSFETLERARQVARLMQERSRSLLPLADHPLAPLECDEWSPGWSERCAEMNTTLQKQCHITTEVSRELASWMQYTRPLTRDDLSRLDELMETLLAPEPVGPAFATTPWTQLSQTLTTYRSWVEERTRLRDALSKVHHPAVAGSVLVACESFPPQTADEVFRKGRELESKLRESREAAKAVLYWMDATHVKLSRAQLIKLSSLAEALLDVKEIGASFPLAPWDVWSVEIDRWIKLVRERMELRSQLSGYDETTLLALDLDLLRQKWEKAGTAWFLPKMLNKGAVKSALRKALPPKVQPEADKMGGVVDAALRLRDINSELGSVNESAEAMLAGTWSRGEPDADVLTEIWKWGGVLNERLQDVAGTNEAWLTKLREILAQAVQQSVKTLLAGGSVGNKLVTFCETFSVFDEACQSFVLEAALQRPLLEDAEDYFASAEHCQSVFLTAAPRLREINAGFASGAASAEASLGILWQNGEPSAESLIKLPAWGGSLHSRMQAFAGEDFAWLGSFRQLLASLFTEGPSVYAPGTAIGSRMARFREQWSDFSRGLQRYAAEVRLSEATLNSAADYLAATRAFAERVAGAWPKIREWCSWQKARQETVALGLTPLAEKLESPDDAGLVMPELFERSFRRALLFAIVEKEPVLRDFFGNEHNERIERFRELDERLAKLSTDLIRARLATGIPRDNGKDDVPKAEIGLLRRELAKRVRHIPVRQLIGRIPTLLPRLKPCVLMSPLSVAQYLEASHETFDVVIFDEASQIPVWDAIGAIARGSQLIVVGDPKQLPPTNFFASNTDDDDNLTPDEHKDLESILDELMTHGLRHKRLQWHYRSRHEGLITFSNRQYYENDLLTFPSPELELGGVQFRHIPNARYDKGKSRTNRLEAEALVQELVTRLRDPRSPRRSYGVVTFSQAQQALVENLLDEERRKYPDIEHHFGEEPPVESEPVFVKNLENVQGDERDVILFSICYGMDEAGKLSMNFGPLNREGGERRLNVAVTRAKHEVLVFSGLRGDQIDLTRTQRRGVRDLKYFLEYAERGPRALAAATTTASLADADSEFERMVADRIRTAGYDVHHQVGCSGYRIDLAVVDPTAPGRYLLGVECDGATYHRAATARDRDKLRQAVLEDLGWKLHRIWSTDWWHSADSEIEKLLNAITRIKEERELELSSRAVLNEVLSDPEAVTDSSIESPPELDSNALGSGFSNAGSGTSVYEVADFTSFSLEISAERFYDQNYETTLTQLIAHVLEKEAPILDEVLVNRIARAHGFQRSGRVIQDRVLELAKRYYHVRRDPIGGLFIWRDSKAPDIWSQYRAPVSEESTRRIEEIAFEELRAAIPAAPIGDIAVEIARIFGIRRLALSGRARLEAVLREAAPEKNNAGS
jgi:very-short-patch-repair endonuclease